MKRRPFALLLVLPLVLAGCSGQRVQTDGKAHITSFFAMGTFIQCTAYGLH